MTSFDAPTHGHIGLASTGTGIIAGAGVGAFLPALALIGFGDLRLRCP